jgi:ADP-ribose pyrophosphatase
MHEPWTVLSSSVAYDNPWARVLREDVRLPNGKEIDYYINHHPDVAMVFAVTESKQVLLVRQYKHGALGVTLELPGGQVDPDEDPVTAAVRELEEETGYACTKPPKVVGVLLDNATKHRNRIYVVLCEDVALCGAPELDGNEAASGIEVETVSIEQLPSLVGSGEICAASSVASIYQAIVYLSAG